MKENKHIDENFRNYDEMNKDSKSKYDYSNVLYEKVIDKHIDSNNKINIDKRNKHELCLELKNNIDLLVEFNDRIKIEKIVNDALKVKNNNLKHAFLILDIDNFKKINRKYGRIFGDKILKKVALELNCLVRVDDVIVRSGGDEFIIFIKNILNNEDILKRANEICKNINLIFFNDFPNLHISCSCGISIAPDCGKDFFELYDLAYFALSEAKQSGKNCSKIYGENEEEVKNNNTKVITKKNKILVADDIDINRKILKSIFSDEYDVIEAENGQVALDILKEKQSEILAVILDIIMPIKNGFEVMNEMKKDNLIADIPVIVVTMIDEIENEVKALEMGAVDLIVKPYNSKVIKERIRNVISRKEINQIQYQNQVLKKQNETAERYRIIVEQTGAIVYEWNPIDRTFYSSEGIKEFLISKTKPELLFIDKGSLGYFHPNDYEKVFKVYCEDILNGDGKTKITVRLKKFDSSFVWCEVTVNCIRDSYGNIQRIIGTITDVDEKIKAEQKLVYMAKYDELTGIYDKDEFYRKTVEMIDRNKNTPYAMIVMNISRFKVLNDIFGLKAGDRLLCFIANYMKNNFNSNITFGRLQSDNFAICAPANKKNIISLIEDIEKNIAKYPLDFNIIVNFGVYLIEKYDECVSLMCDKASIALATIKGNYVNRYEFYDGNMRKDLMKQQELINDMKLAMQNGEFNIHIQPQVEYKTGKIVSGEALVRWNHKVKGVISPYLFISLFEENGFITKLDKYIWELTCKTIRRWMDEGKEVVPISVNVSRVDMYDYTLNEYLNNLVKKYKLPSGILKLEITETAYMENSKQLIDIVNELRKSGFKVLIDDFGSGYSSLNMLKEVHVDSLKLDRSFVQDSNINKNSECILTAVIYMAKSLNLPIIAEGVETKEQADFLGELGCEIIQGYYYSKPLSVEDFENLINNKREFRGE